MPAIATLTHVQGASVELYGNAAESAVRTGHVEGLPTTGNPEDVLWSAMTATGMPGMGSLYPNRTNCWLTRIQVFGISADKAAVRLIYEPFQGVGTSLIIDISSSLSSYTTNFLPGTKTAFRVNWKSPSGSSIPDIPDDFVDMTLLRPLRRIAVTQLRSGTLDAAEAASFSANVGLVNNATWMGLGKNAWIISGANATISRYAGYYSRRIEAMSQGTDLWSHYGVLRSSTTGKAAGGPGTGPGSVQEAIDVLKGYAYVGKQVYPYQDRGVIRVDPYDSTNFTPLFGV